MDSIEFIKKYLADSILVKESLLLNSELLNKIANVAEIIVSAYNNGNKLLLAGNGGSAADSQHIAAEFVSRFYYDRPGLPAMALTTDSSILTAIGNDYGYEHLFSRQIQAQAKKGDIFIGISTSGNSKNIVNAIKVANELELETVVFCGESGQLKELANVAITVPSKNTPYIQECHICIGHMICAIVEDKIFPRSKDV